MLHSTAREPAATLQRAPAVGPHLLPLSDELRADLRRRITHFANRAETVEELVMALHPEREPPFYGPCELIGG